MLNIYIHLFYLDYHSDIKYVKYSDVGKPYYSLFLSILFHRNYIKLYIHAKSQKEIYHILTVEGRIYLPPVLDADKIYQKHNPCLQETFIYKRCKDSEVPQIEKLLIKSILKWAWSYKHRFLSTFYDYDKYQNWDWIWNLLNSIAHYEL